MSLSAQAREAAFLDPGSGAGSSEEAIKVDPKPDIDIGETALNVAKRAAVFFVNQTAAPVKIEKIVVNGDANVTAEATANDCVKQGVIEASSRCSVEISVTPNAPGAWNVDVLMTHNGAGRLTRAHLTGKTTGTGVVENKNAGLAVNSKEVKPVDFGEVTIGDSKIVRSTLMVNDSPEPITLYAIDVIEADNGLRKLDQGCAPDMELPPGASCPVTLVWAPKNNQPVSTDLIIRHSGKMGFAVIPIRGTAKGGVGAAVADNKTADDKKGLPLPPSAADLEKELAGHLAPIGAAALRAPGGGSGAGDGDVHLIGTVGARAVLLQPNGETAVVPIGGTFKIAGKTAKIVAVAAHSADIVIDDKRRTLALEAAASLVARAAEDQQADAAQQQNPASSGKSTPIQSVALDKK